MDFDTERTKPIQGSLLKDLKELEREIDARIGVSLDYSVVYTLPAAWQGNISSLAVLNYLHETGKYSRLQRACHRTIDGLQPVYVISAGVKRP